MTHPINPLTLGATLELRLRAHAMLIAESYPAAVECAERCGDPIITSGVNAQDIVFFRDPDALADGILHFEPYHRDCANRAYGSAKVVA